MRQESLLLGNKVVGDECVAARLDSFQITAESDTRLTDGNHGCTGAVAQRNSSRGRPTRNKEFRRARGWRTDFDLAQTAGLERATQVSGACAFGSPAPQTPVGTAFWEMDAAETEGFVSTKPVIPRRDIRFCLLQPKHGHGFSQLGDTSQLLRGFV